MSRHVLVQRCILPPASDVSRPYDVLSLSNLQNGLFEPIDRVSSSSSSISHINSALAMPVLSKTSSNNSSISSENLQQPESSNSSDSGCVVMGTLDMPNLDFLEEETTRPSATSTTLPEGAQDEATSKLTHKYSNMDILIN